MRIEKNTICYTSEVGYRNFWYPTTTKLLIKEDCDVIRMSWISGGNKVPIKILKSYLIPLDITDATTKNISPPTENDYTIVWVEKCLRN